MKKQNFDKRLLVNLAKGTTAWAVLTSVVALPTLMDMQDPVSSYLLGCAAVGIIWPLGILCTQRPSSIKNVGNWYVGLFDNAINAIRPNQKQR